MKTELVTDLPMGVLLMVIAQFFLIGVYYLIGTTQWYTLIAVVLCSVAYWKLFNIGVRVAFFGIEVETE